jgi:N-acyl homoserine lactone hydrolase
MPDSVFAGALSAGGDVEVHRLDLGHVVQPDTSPVAGDRCPILGYAVRHPRGVFLFDTGLGAPHPLIDELYRPARMSLAAALTAAGIDPRDVNTVVNSHLHFDHCGANPLFPGVPVYAQAREHRATRDPLFTIRERVDFPDVDLRLHDGRIEIAHGITIVPTPGHTLGHQSLVLETTVGAVVLTGQVVYSAREFADPESPAPAGADSAADPAAARDSIRSLRGLNPALVLFAHDEAVWMP